ncbi:MAG: hypothetical protein H6755_02680 [Candidatus Omnitrophica bacterium]|nr:hypothetical protein [Candidatus Omnitrophota bacterium]
MSNRGKVILFCGGSLFVALIYIILIVQSRLPDAHDTFQYLQQQYIYYNEVVQHRNLPNWFPYLTHGNVGNYYFSTQLTLLSPVFYLLGLLFSNINYYYLFYAGIFFEELFFLIGIILLGSLYYRDQRTVAFVAIALVGSNIWYPQIFWNFHLYYFLPILLFSIHKWFQTKKIVYVYLSLIFFGLSFYGNFLYCFILTSFVILSYLCVLFLVNFRENIQRLKKEYLGYYSSINVKKLGVFLLLLIVLFLSFYYVKFYDSEIAYLGGGRESSGQVKLETFLKIGGYTNLNKFKEIFTRRWMDFTPDINLYAGFLYVPFVIVALLFSREKYAYVTGAVALVIFLFSIGSFVAKSFYYLYPLGKLFRHIGLTVTIFKLFSVFYAGFGFEIFLKKFSKDRWFIILLAVLLLPVSWLSWKGYGLNTDFLWFAEAGELKVLKVLPLFIWISMGGVIVGWLVMKLSLKAHLIYFMLFLLAVDMYSYKYSLTVLRMPKIDKEVKALFKPYDYGFESRRIYNSFTQKIKNSRMKVYEPLLFMPYHDMSKYNTIDSFLYGDSLFSSFRTDFALKPFKDFVMAAKEYPHNDVYFKYAGLKDLKLSVFTGINYVDNLSDMQEIFQSTEFTGDMLFTTKEDLQQADLVNIGQKQEFQSFKNKSERGKAYAEIKEFSFDSLRINVDIEEEGAQPYFLYYADVYHPNWKAYVNRKEVPIIKTNIAYKSILLPAGRSEVEFRFGHSFYTISMACILSLGILALMATGYLVVTEFRK